MATVFLCSPTNSTMFTTCCEVAITDQEQQCPTCRQEVLPFGRNERWSVAYRRAPRYGNPSPNDRPCLPDAARVAIDGGLRMSWATFRRLYRAQLDDLARVYLSADLARGYSRKVDGIGTIAKVA
jgi:hypothetical protein